MAEFKRSRDKDRRSFEDKRLIMKFFRWLSVVGWALMFAALLVIGYAKPETQTFWDKWHDVSVRTTWNTDLVRWIFYFMIIGLGISISGIVASKLKQKRKYDSPPLNLFVLAAICIAGIYFYLKNF